MLTNAVFVPPFVPPILLHLFIIKISSMATVSIILREDKIKKDGTAPLHFLIIKDRKKSKITTGISIDPKHWNDQKQMVKPGATNSARINSLLKNKLAELQDKVYEHETISKSLTTKRLKEKIFGKTPSNFFEFSKKVLVSYDKQKMYGTYDRAKAILNKIEAHNGSRNLMFQDITPDFLESYDTYCRKELNNRTNTVNKDMRFIRKVFNDAIRSELVEIQDSPFLKYKLKTEKTHRVFLSEGELTAIENVECEKNSRIGFTRDMFVFAAYVGGLRVSDVLLLKWKNVTDTHIQFVIRKTGTQLSIKIPTKALSILNIYRPKKKDSEKYVFPMLPEELDENNLRLIDCKISSATASMNCFLKKIASAAEVDKVISFHSSRHTFATRALRKGISIDKVSKLMGHSAIRETQVYAKIVNEELDKAMDAFNEPALSFVKNSA